MSKTKLTMLIEHRFNTTFPFLEREYPLGGGCRCDLGGIYGGNSYGIEVKTSIPDMRSGFGLNQEKFDFGYLAVLPAMVEFAIGHLYVKGFHKTGVIAVDVENNCYEIVKPAEFNPKIPNPAYQFLGIQSKIEVGI